MKSRSRRVGLPTLMSTLNSSHILPQSESLVSIHALPLSSTQGTVPSLGVIQLAHLSRLKAFAHTVLSAWEAPSCPSSCVGPTHTWLPWQSCPEHAPWGPPGNPPAAPCYFSQYHFAPQKVIACIYPLAYCLSLLFCSMVHEGRDPICFIPLWIHWVICIGSVITCSW